jgi:PAS domain S-box-containing protein
MLLQEVADRTTVEEELRQVNRLFKTLYEANQAIIHAQDPETLYWNICHIIIEQSDLLMAWVGRVDRESGLLRPVAASGEGTGYLDSIMITSDEGPWGCGPTGVAAREGIPVICNDFINDPRTGPWRDNAAAHGFRASAAFPLKCLGDPVAVLAVYAALPDYFDQRCANLFVGLSEDISFALETMELERQRKEAVRELREAQRVAGVGSWQLYLESGEVRWSDELYRIHGFAPGDPIPDISGHDRLFAPESLARLNAALEQTLRVGVPYHLDLEIIRPDGARRWITAQGEAVYGEHDRITMLRGTCLDITERRQLEQELIRAKRLEVIGQVAGGVAHEVRNPLNAILSVSEALFREEGVGDNPEFEPYIRHIRSQVNRLARLMNDLLELGKPIPAARLAPVVVRSVCEEAINLLELSGVTRGRRFSLNIAPEHEHLLVMADNTRMQQILSNLLENALQHSPPGGEVTLSLACCEPDWAGDGMAVIHVSDTGSGIPEELTERIFEPFYSSRKGGTGLGLALVKHFIESMGGTVRIRNNDPPPGCTAEVRIPLIREIGG